MWAHAGPRVPSRTPTAAIPAWGDCSSRCTRTERVGRPKPRRQGFRSSRSVRERFGDDPFLGPATEPQGAEERVERALLGVERRWKVARTDADSHVPIRAWHETAEHDELGNLSRERLAEDAKARELQAINDGQLHRWPS